MSASPYRRHLRPLPALPPRRSPWIRALLAAAVLGTLPFGWSEDVSCDGQPKPVLTGLEHLFGKHFFDEPAPGLVFLSLLALAVGLGLLARSIRRPWGRLATEVLGATAALAGTFMCALMFTNGRPEQPHDHPAAWIGTLASLAITIQAWFMSGEALRRGLIHRRARRRRALAERAARAESELLPWPRVEETTAARIAAPQQVQPEESLEADDVEEAPGAVRRR